MSETRPIIIVHTRDPNKPDEWRLWGLTDESLVALFHARGCIPGDMVDAESIRNACHKEKIGPDAIDVCVTCGHQPKKVYLAMQAMIDCSTSRPIFVAIHNGIGGKKETIQDDDAELKFPAGSERSFAVYSIGDGTCADEHHQIIREYTLAANANSNLLEYEAALKQLTEFLLEQTE